jgi:hypothetical protein
MGDYIMSNRTRSARRKSQKVKRQKEKPDLKKFHLMVKTYHIEMLDHIYRMTDIHGEAFIVSMLELSYRMIRKRYEKFLNSLNDELVEMEDIEKSKEIEEEEEMMKAKSFLEKSIDRVIKDKHEGDRNVDKTEVQQGVSADVCDKDEQLRGPEINKDDGDTTRADDTGTDRCAD